MISDTSLNINNQIKLLDVGVGRGGDMMKWNNANIKNVIGIDINKSYIIEAIKRFKNQRSFFNNNYKFFYCYENFIFQDYLKSKNINFVHEFDIISCMFAFHYFWKDEKTLENILQQISKSLKPNGFFIGTCPDGDKIFEYLQNTDVFQNEAVMITKTYKNNKKTIGNSIDFMLSGTLYFGDNMISNEYLVFKDIFIEKCKKYDLNLIEYTNFENLYTHNYNLNENYKIASFLNTKFVFKKSPIRSHE
jgi:mRNA (guanine-N7-)-methyltransferase